MMSPTNVSETQRCSCAWSTVFESVSKSASQSFAFPRSNDTSDAG